jgi:hypothetical protein
MGIQAILALINAAIPNVASLIVAIKNANGGVDIGVLLSSADADYQKSVDQAQAWLAAHPATTKPPTP